MIQNLSPETLYYYLLQYYDHEVVSNATYGQMFSMLKAIGVRQKIENQNLIEILDYHRYRGEVIYQKNGSVNQAKTKELRKTVMDLRESLILTDPNKENSIIEKAKATQAEYERIMRLSGKTQ